jgi:cytochrome c-type biogenesis protein CcmH
MMLWFVFALLTGAAVFSVLWPLSRAPTEVNATALDVAFYGAQTAEIDREASRGSITPEDAVTARTEAARRLLIASRRQERAPRSASAWPVRAVALGAVVFVPVTSLALYHQVGAPDMPDQPLQARLNASPARMDMATAIARIEQHLVQNPQDGRGWAVLAPIYLRLQRYDDAQRAFANAIRLLGPTADRYAALGEAQVLRQGGMVSTEAQRSFKSAIGLDMKSPAANFYLGLAASQDGDKAKAEAIWRRLIADSPADAPWVPVVRAHLAALDAPASPGQSAAAPADQQAMIHRMVDGLATRLQSNGNDIDGWLRLMRAYRVLNEPGKAKLAFGNARRNFASDPAAMRRLDDLAHELGLES